MKLIIRQQILLGNLDEGFDLDGFLPELDAEWVATVRSRYPDSEVEIDRDIQRASGYTREMNVEVYNDDGEWVDDGGDLVDWLLHDEEKLADDSRWYA